MFWWVVIYFHWSIIFRHLRTKLSKYIHKYICVPYLYKQNIWTWPWHTGLDKDETSFFWYDVSQTCETTSSFIAIINICLLKDFISQWKKVIRKNYWWITLLKPASGANCQLMTTSLCGFMNYCEILSSLFQTELRFL